MPQPPCDPRGGCSLGDATGQPTKEALVQWLSFAASDDEIRWFYVSVLSKHRAIIEQLLPAVAEGDDIAVGEGVAAKVEDTRLASQIRGDIAGSMKLLEEVIEEKFHAITLHIDTCFRISTSAGGVGNGNDPAPENGNDDDPCIAVKSIAERHVCLPQYQIENQVNADAKDLTADNHVRPGLNTRRSDSRLAVGAKESWTKAGQKDDLKEPVYRVEDCYRKTGVCQDWARSDWMHHLSLVMVCFNAVYLGIDADYNHAHSLYAAHWGFIIFENIFAMYFTFELAIRFIAFKKKIDFFRDGWCLLDTLVVADMVFETWILAPIVASAAEDAQHEHTSIEPVRLLRLLRLTRMSRLTNYFPELLTLTKSLVAGVRAVITVFAFTIGLTYTFAILLQAFMGSKEEFNATYTPRNFSTVKMSMWTLLLDGTFLMSADKLLTSMMWSGDAAMVMSGLLFSLFILLSAVTLMNMLIGSLCEVVSSVTKGEQDAADIKLMKDTILARLLALDNGDGILTRDEFFNVIHDIDTVNDLAALNIDQRFLSLLAAVLYPNSTSLIDLHRVMELTLMCRGDLPVTVHLLAWAHESLVAQLNERFERFERFDASLANSARVGA